MEIAIIGTGYVGLVTGACLADFGQTVRCIDADGDRIAALHQGEMPFYEPGLAELVQRQVKLGRLHFMTSVSEGCAHARVVFLAVGTPEGVDGEADLSQVLTAATALIPSMQRGYRVVVTKSTVPVGTGRRLRDFFRDQLGAGAEFDVVSNPEFLREGSAVSDFMRPDRVVIGATSDRAAAIMRDVYRPLYLIETPIVLTTPETAEMIKYASNAFLAVKISFTNEIANLCDSTGSDVHVVAKGMGLDKRIGPKFLHPGPGYGGSCFPKDTRALARLGVRHGIPLLLVDAAIRVNERQRQLAVEKIAAAVQGLDGKHIALLGLAFKPNTSDVREAPAIHICRELAARGAMVSAYDPVAMHEAAPLLAPYGHIAYAADPYAAAAHADALVIATEWNEFRALDFRRLYELLRQPVIVDLRNVLDPAHAEAEGFTYISVGRGANTDRQVAVAT
jgi:UDPglucose 6-dehydrogenase